MANSVHWYGGVTRREDGRVLEIELDIEVEGEIKKDAEEDMEEAGRRRKNEGWFEQGRSTLLSKVYC